MILQDWRCPEHGLFEAVADNSDVDAMPCPQCSALSSWAPSPVRGRVKAAEFTRGGSDTPPPRVLDTNELGDGMPIEEWRAKRRAACRDERRAEIKAALS